MDKENGILDVNALSNEQMELIQNQMNARRFKSLEKRTEQLDKRVTKIENSTPVSPAVSNYLTKERRKKVIDCLGGKGSKAYKHTYRPEEKEHYKGLANKTFAEMERDFKDYFDIVTYADLSKENRERAEQYIEDWSPSNNTKLEIRNINNQLQLLEGQQ